MTATGVKTPRISEENWGKGMAGAAGLEPVTSAVTGQRSNQLSYTPAMGLVNLRKRFSRVKPKSAKNYSGSRRQGGGGGEPR